MKWMEIARTQIGVKEVPGDGDNPQIVDYHRHTTLQSKDDETPWCAAFVNWCLDRAGCKTTHRANARSFLELVDCRCPLQIGAIAVLWRGRPVGAQGHVGFVTGFDDNTVELLGGNQGDAVSIARFDRKRLLGCRWPQPLSLAEPAAAG